MSLAKKIISGDQRALARALTFIEDGDAASERILAELHAHGGKAHLVGVTGAPGVGKSTLVNALAQSVRARGDTVGVLAVDPTSPFSSGAVLGDRIRMRDLAGDKGIYIRSMATRGALGGLSHATAAAADVLDAAGFDCVLIETVGVGQAGVEIAANVHTTIVLMAPGSGDDVQAIKAGILEIADILVVNKADLSGAEQTRAYLRSTLTMGQTARAVAGHPHSEQADTPSPGWEVPLLMTVASVGEGVDELLQSLVAHHDYLASSGELDNRQRERMRAIVELRLRNRLYTRLVQQVSQQRFDALLQAIVARETDPYSAVASLMEDID
ncbi:MAG: methylmalonyl Co-A mutase-associated GTPase MeaB [Anaerolineales bacterium]|jgi:LAO/AO transport system kinase|nr:methylmalonyl Co-A mutase-associated GTPase MeaB [Anaerolineales bacterium]MDP7643928.1 methylmalonyl Co-A mutase-associated GTPase MeaB [Anaerolineales bacterium]HJN41703.1 methylmalonyl Co-A mutase-associated GTPase MeaB [Anaerolineales bacterium]|tara:strand:- start:831 stop:1811 length:981 start_codon:yes stop_codon:yes gene_type:complete